jgi:L-ribulokinase
MLMQIYTDVTNLPLSIITSDRGPALGSAIHAAVAAGAYPDVPAAAAATGSVERDVFQPIPENVTACNALYTEYTALYDYFGRGGSRVMHRLKAIQRETHRKPRRP